MFRPFEPAPRPATHKERACRRLQITRSIEFSKYLQSAAQNLIDQPLKQKTPGATRQPGVIRSRKFRNGYGELHRRKISISLTPSANAESDFRRLCQKNYPARLSSETGTLPARIFRA